MAALRMTQGLTATLDLADREMSIGPAITTKRPRGLKMAHDAGDGPQLAIDPVCGMSVDPHATKLTHVHT